MIFGWSPRIGDPTTIGWAIVAAYVVTAGLCWRAGTRDRRRTGDAGLWPWLAAGLLAMGLNKQLDLQTLIVGVGRHVARTQGWYEQRATVQLLFIVVLTVATIGLCLALGAATRRRSRYERRALLGVAVLSFFVLIRAASFHHIDRLLGFSLSGLRVNQVLESTGILLIALPSLAASRTRMSRRRTRSTSDEQA